MLKFTFAFTILLLSGSISSQIIIKDYPKEIKCDIDGLVDLPKVEATNARQTGMTEETFSGGCLGTLVRTYTFEDDKGQRATAQQFISITDNSAPVLYGEAPDMIVEAAHIPNPASFASRDNSGQEYEVVFSEERQGKLITRHWMCTDACGNVAEKKQLILIK